MNDGMSDGGHYVYIKGNDVVETEVSMRADAMAPECQILVKDVAKLGNGNGSGNGKGNGRRLGTDRAQWADLSAEKTVTFAHTF